ncbi:MAG: hypothetical protein WCP55_14245, partial [Lentisphaerota bacterium]
MQRIFTCVFVLMIMLASIIVFGNYDGGYLRDITMNYKTASLDWGSNKNNLNVLFIVPRQGGREVVELVQRLPMNYEAVTASNSVILAEDGNIYEAAVAGTSGYEKKLELFKKLEKKYDLFVIGNFEFRRLPEEAQFKILSQVAHGAGLIIIYPGVLELKKVFSTPVEGAEEILSLAPLKGLPAEVQKVPDKDLLKTYQFKEGRILVLDYKAYRGAYVGMALTAPNEFSNRWQAEYENSMVLLIRSMLWAAGEKLVSVTLPGFVEEQPQSGGSIKFKCTQTKGYYELHTRIRDEFNQIVKEYNNELSDTLSVDLPFLPGGKYYLDFILKNKNGEVLNLGSRSFKVESPLGRLSLFTNDKESFEKNEKIKVILRIQKPLATIITIAVSLVDSPYGRVWYEKRIKLNEGEEKTEFEIDKFYMPTIAGYLKCSILNGNDEIAKCEKTLFFPDRGLEIYPTLSFNGVPGEYLGLFYAKQVVDRMGWRIGLKMPEPDGGNARTAALLNQRFAPYTTLIGVEEDKNKKGWTKQYDWFCLPPGECKKANEVEDQSFYNPEIKKLFRKGIEYRIKNIVKYGPPVYSLGDENHVDINAGFTPSDNAEFKRFLKARYETIESLNKEWGSNYKSFDDTEHYTLQQA